MVFADRVDAGRRLATKLQHLRSQPVVVLGLPRGGVPVAAEVARALHAPLDVIVVRKLGLPSDPELAMGAIGEDGVRVVNDAVVRQVGVSSGQLDVVEARERVELERRAKRFRGVRPRVDLRGRTALIVDDGIATGSTARAACQVARAHGAARVVLAVPVAPVDWVDRLHDDADELIAFETPEPFWAVGPFYANFYPTSDDEVVACLDRVRREQILQPCDEEVAVIAGRVRLGGHLTVPADAIGIVVFAHGSGSSRHSPRNRYVATVLNAAGLGTLLFDLLTPSEEHDRANVFDVALLARRLADARRWLREQPDVGVLPVAYFGASTGAAAALWASTDHDADIAAVVSRGGRPDLAAPRLGAVTAPCLFIVGGDDTTVLELNRQARAQLRCESELAVVPGATHLFEEPGTLEVAAKLARNWFTGHLAKQPQPVR
jgi:putative phosphoribosyl transferase